MSVAVAHSQNMVSSDLLHRRLGHPASKNMDMLHLSDSSTAGFDSKSCEFVFRPKQSHHLFPLSINKTTSVFDLVHCDL